ncbi:MAG: hypothetical protein U0798_04975 [Gemmataceae bacterium]
MHTSGLVLTLRDDQPSIRLTKESIAAVGPFTLGDSLGRSLAVVLEADDADEARNWHDWVASLPGVEHAEVVFVNWDHAEPEVVHVGS